MPILCKPLQDLLPLIDNGCLSLSFFILSMNTRRAFEFHYHVGISELVARRNIHHLDPSVKTEA